MDHFGINAALKGTAMVYFRSARQSGRTTSLLESLSDGDRVLFRNQSEAQYFERMAKERGLKITCVVVSPKSPQKVLHMPNSEGRTVFDHMWLEDYYLLCMEHWGKDIDQLQRQSSGPGEAHHYTLKAAQELAKWQF